MRLSSQFDFGAHFAKPLALITQTNKHLNCQTPQIEAVSWDFVDSCVHRTKLYGSLTVNRSGPGFATLVGRNPDLDSATKVFVDCISDSAPACIPVLLQYSFKHGFLALRQKAMFTCRLCGWDHPEGFKNLIAQLRSAFNIDLWQLYVLLDLCASRNIKLLPSVLAVGPGEPVSLTFYFCPLPEESGGQSVSRSGQMTLSSIVDAMICIAIEYLWSRRSPLGTWGSSGDRPTMDDPWMTAYVVAVLARETNLRKELQNTVRWLYERLLDPTAEGEVEFVAHSVIAMSRLGVMPPECACRMIQSCDVNKKCAARGEPLAELVASVLSARVSLHAAPERADEAAAMLIALQRIDGGWNALLWKDDLVSCSRALSGLNAYRKYATAEHYGNTAGGLLDEVRRAITDGGSYVVEHPVPKEPCAMGHWLVGLCETQVRKDHTRLRRVIETLNATQQADGSWLSGPVRRIPSTTALQEWARPGSGRLLWDQDCVVSTAMVIEGLQRVRLAL
jgi:hypothetical protein